MVRSLLLALLPLLPLTISESVSITRAPAFASQRPCALGCFGGDIFDNAGFLASMIGCGAQNPQNECVCRTDLQSSAESYIQSCVNWLCSGNTLDTDSAVSVYDAYCTSAGFGRDTPATTTTAGTDDSPSVPRVTVTATVTVSSARKRATPPWQDLVTSLASLCRIGRG